MSSNLLTQQEKSNLHALVSVLFNASAGGYFESIAELFIGLGRDYNKLTEALGQTDIFQAQFLEVNIPQKMADHFGLQGNARDLAVDFFQAELSAGKSIAGILLNAGLYLINDQNRAPEFDQAKQLLINKQQVSEAYTGNALTLETLQQTLSTVTSDPTSVQQAINFANSLTDEGSDPEESEENAQENSEQNTEQQNDTEQNNNTPTNPTPDPEPEDTTAPTLSAPTTVSAGSSRIVLTASEEVTGTPQAEDFTLTIGEDTLIVTSVTLDKTNVTLNLGAQIQQETGNISLTYTPSAGNEIKDAADNTLAAISTALTMALTAADRTAPTVQAVSATNDDDTYGFGATINVTVEFSEAVIVSGTPLLTLETGTIDRQASYQSGSGTDTLTFAYQVQRGDETNDLAYTGTSALALNGGAIQDQAGNNATLTLPASGATGSLSANKAIVIETTAPTISSTNYTADAGTKTLVLTTSETVTGTPAAQDFAVTMSSVNNPVTNVVVNGIDITLTLTNAIQNSATLSVNYTQGDNTITDEAGNQLASLNNALSLNVTNDNERPTVTSVSAQDGIYKLGDTIAISVEFSEAVNVRNTPQLTLETGNVDAIVNYASGSGTNTLVFNYTVATNHTSADLSYLDTAALKLNGGSIQDLAGNAATLTLPALNDAGSLSNDHNVQVDGIRPTITSFNPADEATLAATGTMVLTFSENIQLVTGKDLNSAIQIHAPTASDANGDDLIAFTATINNNQLTIDLDENDPDINGTGSQPIYVNIANDAIQDSAGNLFVGINNTTDYNLYLG